MVISRLGSSGSPSGLGFSSEIMMESPTARTPQRSFPNTPALDVISEGDDPLNTQPLLLNVVQLTKPSRLNIITEPLYSDPEAISPTKTSIGISPTKTSSSIGISPIKSTPTLNLKSLPSHRDDEANKSAGNETPISPRQTRRSTTGFPPSTRDPPPRWPFSRPTLNRGISNATDALFSVASIDARDAEALQTFWPRYAQEASHFDRRMISSWHRNLDTRLLFAGIFSAIITPLIVESYKLLEPQGRSPAPGFFSPDGYRIRVNAMWFGSLIASLITALLSIRCKQWLDGYGVDLLLTGSGSPDNLPNVCRMRQYRYQGLQKYFIAEIIGLLPVILYLSLLFFAIGLIDFLWHLNQGIAIYVSVLCGLVIIFHIFTTITPFFTPQSPFRTPLSTLLGNLYRGLWRGKLVIEGLLEQEEINDVDRLGEQLDGKSFRWLMKNTRSEEIYEDCVRAEREYKRLQLKGLISR